MSNKEKAAAEDKIAQLGRRLVTDIEKGSNPGIEVPVSSLSNISFDAKAKTLVLGRKKAKRFFFNVGHVRKFVQTLEIAKLAKSLLDAGKHASLRDVYYMAKRTIPNTSI